MPHHVSLPVWAGKTAAQRIDTLREMVEDLYAYTLGPANAALLGMLDAARPADRSEAESIAQMRALIQAHPNILAQNCEVGHMVGSALVVDISQGRVLLHLHRKLGLWLPLGGHADYETDLAQVALREAFEESGLPDLRFFPAPNGQPVPPADFDVHTIPATADRPEHLHLDFRYLLATTQPQAARIDPEESLDMAWLSFDEALRRDDLRPDVHRLVTKARAAFRDSLSGPAA
ncbi:MAG: NUDIX hydrolase [Chloroflexota bacterium]